MLRQNLFVTFSDVVDVAMWKIFLQKMMRLFTRAVTPSILYGSDEWCFGDKDVDILRTE